LGYGYHTPGALIVAAITPTGRLFVTHEQTFQYESLAVVAKRITNLEARLGVSFAKVACGSVMDPATKTVETPATTLRRLKVPAVAADHAELVGWLRLRSWLENAPDGRPWCVIDPACETLWRALTTAICDPKKLEELHQQSGHPAAVKALRDLVMTMPQPASPQPARTKFARGSIGDMIRREQGKRGVAARIL
jgi:hypothetical protein